MRHREGVEKKDRQRKRDVGERERESIFFKIIRKGKKKKV